MYPASDRPFRRIGTLPPGYRIIEADVPNNAPSTYVPPGNDLEGRGPAQYLDIGDLKDVTPRPAGGTQ